MTETVSSTAAGRTSAEASQPAAAPPSDAEKRAALQEVVRSGTLLRSPRLRNFLTFVCELEIAGREGEITEHAVGVEALGRPSDYSPAEDAVVRRRAADLREKLKEAYATELKSARLRIELPRGGYVPRFVRAEPVGEEPTPTAEPAVLARDADRPCVRIPFNAFWFATGTLAGALVASLGFLALGWFRAAPRPAAEPGTTYEAEASGNILQGTVLRDVCQACSGSERVRRIGGAPANCVIVRDVTVPKHGRYTLVIFYMLDGHRSLFVSVNDEPSIELPLHGDSWILPRRVSLEVPLREGRNTLRLHNDRAYAPDLDRVVIRSAGGLDRTS